MTAFHVFYIPAMLFLGIAIGSHLGKRAAYREQALRERDERDREARRAARATAEASPAAAAAATSVESIDSPGRPASGTV